MRREQRGTGEDGERQRPLQAPQPGYSEGTALAVTARRSALSVVRSQPAGIRPDIREEQRDVLFPQGVARQGEAG